MDFSLNPDMLRSPVEAWQGLSDLGRINAEQLQADLMRDAEASINRAVVQERRERDAELEKPAGTLPPHDPERKVDVGDRVVVLAGEAAGLVGTVHSITFGQATSSYAYIESGKKRVAHRLEYLAVVVKVPRFKDSRQAEAWMAQQQGPIQEYANGTMVRWKPYIHLVPPEHHRDAAIYVSTARVISWEANVPERDGSAYRLLVAPIPDLTSDPQIVISSSERIVGLA